MKAVVGIKKVQTSSKNRIYSKSFRIQKSCYSKINNKQCYPGYIIYLSTTTSADEEDFIEDILSYYTEDQEDTINRLERQMIECQETTRNLVSKYIIELETERGKVRKLNEIIDQQDKRIRSIKKEKSVKKLMYEQDEYINSNDELLNVLVELQTIELIEKKKMIIELRQERKELLKKVHVLNGISMRESIDSTTTQSFDSSCSSNNTSRSSIDMLEDISSSTIINPITPPSSPPPKYPIPPIPRKNKNRKKQDKVYSSSSFSKKLNTASFLIKSWKRKSTVVVS